MCSSYEPGVVRDGMGMVIIAVDSCSGIFHMPIDMIKRITMAFVKERFGHLHDVLHIIHHDGMNGST